MDMDSSRTIKRVIVGFLIIITMIYIVVTFKDDYLRLNSRFTAFDKENAFVKEDGYYIQVEEGAQKGELIYATLYTYKPGKYHVKLHCSVESEGSSFKIINDGYVSEDNKFIKEVLPETPFLVGTTDYECDFDIPSQCRDVKLVIYFGGKGNLTVGRAYQTSSGMYYHDSLFVMAGISLLIVVMVNLRRRKMLNLKIFDEGLTSFGRFFFLLVITIVASFPLLGRGFYEGADLQFHLERIQAIASALASGQFPVRMQPVWHYGVGYPLSIFYPDLLLYPAGVLVMLGASEYFSLCVMLYIANYLTAYFAYTSFSNVIGDDIKGVIAASAYTLSAFRFMILYQGSGYGCVLAMMFVPMVFEGVYNVVFGDSKRWHPLAIGMSGIISSHILTSVMATILCALVTIIGAVNFKDVKRLFSVIKAIFLTIALNAWYIVPFLDSYNKDYNICFFQSEINKSAVYIPQMFQWINEGGKSNIYGSETAGEMPVSVGILFAFSILGYIIILFQEKKRNTFLGICMFISMVTLWMASDFFPWDYIIRIPMIGKLLYRAQFAWRYELIATVGLSVITAEVICYFWKKTDYSLYLIGLTICVINIVPSIDSVTNNYAMFFQDKYQYKYHFIDDTENVDYMYRDLPYETLRELPRTIAVKNANVKGIKRSGVDLFFDYEKEGKAEFVLPMIAYPHYKAYINDEEVTISSNGTHQIVLFAEENMADKGSVKLVFIEPLFWRVCEIVSLLTAVVLVVVYNKRRRKIAFNG